MNFLSYDSPFMTTYRMLVDYILLGVLWIVACLPVISFGAATTAMLLTAESSIHKDQGKILRTFWKHFCKEFKSATILWLIQLPILLVLCFNVCLLYIDQLPVLLRVITFTASAVAFCWVQLWFAYLSKFEDRLKTLLYNTFCITFLNPGKSFFMALTIVVAIVTTVVVFLQLPPILPVVPGIFIWSYTALMRKMFDKYSPEEKRMLPEKTE